MKEKTVHMNDIFVKTQKASFLGLTDRFLRSCIVNGGMHGVMDKQSQIQKTLLLARLSKRLVGGGANTEYLYGKER